MKKNLFMVAAVALVALVSCNKETDNSVQSAPVSDVTFEAEIVQTKTAIGDADAEGNRNVTWVLGDQVNINGTLFTATGYKEDGKAIFETENLAFETAELYNAIYPATAGSSLEAVTVSAEQDGTFANAGIAVAQSENRSLAFMNVASMLKFQVPAACSSVTIESTANLAGTVSVSFDNEGLPVIGEVADASKVITLENVKADQDYYVAILPGEHQFTVTLDGIVSKASVKTVTAARAQLLNLGVLPLIKESEYGLVGSFQSPTAWDVAAPVKMFEHADGWAVAEGVELYKDDEFKFVMGNSWENPNFGTKEAGVLNENKETSVEQNGQNMKVSKNGKYNLYLNPNAKLVKVECVEEYTNLTVDITIDNKANWSPLSISLWSGDEQVVTNASVSNNKYSVSADYIGSTLTCQLSTDSKTSEKMSLSITKHGATVTLEETIVKLYFQLDTDNTKQWWGNTTKIHVWNTGTSFDTTWPGNTMTFEGNYTWSIVVPSELVGKTINYLVHNGNNWKSNDSTVTIKAEGVTVKGSSINVK